MASGRAEIKRMYFNFFIPVISSVPHYSHDPSPHRF